jgi:hypothetical protein
MKNNGSAPNPTMHAMERWKQRFPEHSIVVEFVNSKPLGHGRMRKRVIAGLRGKARHEMLGPFNRHYYLYSKRSGAVFVMTRPSIVITVLQMPSEPIK